MPEPPHRPEEQNGSLPADELDLLRRAWEAIEAPSLPEELAQTDPQTRRAVELLRRAWSEVSAPPLDAMGAAQIARMRQPGPSSAPSAASVPMARRMRRVPARWSAAAALLLLLLTWRARPTRLAHPLAGADRLPAPSSAGSPGSNGAIGGSGRAPRSPSGDGATTAASGARRFEAASESVQALTPEVGEGNLEFRSGRVRLVLVTDAGRG